MLAAERRIFYQLRIIPMAPLRSEEAAVEFFVEAAVEFPLILRMHRVAVGSDSYGKFL